MKKGQISGSAGSCNSLLHRTLPEDAASRPVATMSVGFACLPLVHGSSLPRETVHSLVAVALVVGSFCGGTECNTGWG